MEEPRERNCPFAPGQSWLDQLKNDKKLVVHAAAAAQKAADFILGKGARSDKAD